jgi:hypothetical protein
MPPSTTASPAAPARGWNLALWSVQALLALLFVGTGFWKLLTPLPKLASQIPWAGQVSPAFLYTIAAIDFCGGIGIIVPALTRIWPRLTLLAALGIAALMVCAIVFHVRRGEASVTPFNVFVVGLALFVLWGRLVKAPLAPRA